MVMNPLVCNNDCTSVIYGCLNVLPNRTSSRSASIVVPENYSTNKDNPYLQVIIPSL